MTFLLRWLVALPRTAKVLVLVLADGFNLALAADLAILLRQGQTGLDAPSAFWFMTAAPLAGVPLLALAGVYKAVIRFLSIDNLFAALFALTALAVGLGIFLLPVELAVIFWFLAGTGVCGSRLLVNLALTRADRRQRSRVRVAIYGAGEAGRQLAVALARNSDFAPVAFLDDSAMLQGRSVLGIGVHPPSAIGRIVTKLAVTRVLLAMPSITRARRKEILTFLGDAPVKVLVMPGLAELASGQRQIDDLREADVEDLLGRDPVPPDPQLLGACITGQVVMVTGAGGSIGAELCRQIVALAPAKLLLFEISESALYAIDHQLRSLPAVSGGKAGLIVPVLGDVQDGPRLDAVMEAYGVSTIYHAAAYKHVPIVEHNPVEGVRNNVFGTLSCAQAAIRNNVKAFLLVSTDKAVRPTSVMGASKRMAEMVLQALALQQRTTRFCIVRFGNVLASSGSVVPLFREQIRSGGPITVTHPDVVRYFMTIPEAASLVIQAGSMGQGGDVFLLDMGEPVRILDLARRMVHLSGLQVRDDTNKDGDIEIVFPGLRAGEKLFEELLVNGEGAPTAHPMIYSSSEQHPGWDQLQPILRDVERACEKYDLSALRDMLGATIEGYSLQSKIVDGVWESRRSQSAL